MERILVLLAAPAWQDAAEALRSARDSAARPERVSYGLSLREEPEEEALAGMRALGSTQYLCPGESSWQDAELLWQGEGYVLIAHEAMRFTRRWDENLLRALRRCKREGATSAVLTGCLPCLDDPVDAVRPVAAEGFDPQGRLCFHPGTALCYAKTPLRSAFVNPDFCFGPAGFFRTMGKAEEQHLPLFLRAFKGKWEAFTLHRPLIHMNWEQPISAVEAEEGMEGLGRFESRFGIRFKKQQLSAMVRQGVFTPDLDFPRHVPLGTRLQAALRELLPGREGPTPLCVTAWLTPPQPEDSLLQEFMSWFSRMAKLRNLALLCYADGASCRRLTAVHPNVLEYKKRYGLPVKGEVQPREALNYVRLCKPFLLAQSREKQLGHSHYVWVDFGYLRHPVYERTAFDWRELCTDRIVLGQVQGQLDLTMIVVPQQHLLPLCQEIAGVCQSTRAQTGILPDEKQLWQELVQARPDRFTLVELPRKRTLLLRAMK